MKYKILGFGNYTEEDYNASLSFLGGTSFHEMEVMDETGKHFFISVSALGDCVLMHITHESVADEVCNYEEVKDPISEFEGTMDELIEAYKDNDFFKGIKFLCNMNRRNENRRVKVIGQYLDELNI